MRPLAASNAGRQGNAAAAGPKRNLPSFAIEQLSSPADLDALLARADLGGVEAVRFGPNFPVTDEHVVRLVQQAIGGQLLSLRLGNTDTGHGSSVTDAAVQRIAAICPRLQELELSSACKATDRGFAAIASGLGELLVLHVTGHDRQHGALTKKAVQPLLTGGALPHLPRLYLTDQGIDPAALERLVVKRRQLVIQVGDTDRYGGFVTDLKYYKGMERDLF